MWAKRGIFAPEQDGPILWRTKIVSTRWFAVYIHDMETADPQQAMHDHPWWFASIVLRGGYVETWARAVQRKAFLGTPRGRSRTRTWGAGSIHTMGLNDVHRITAIKPNTKTLVIRGPRVREWGFWTSQGWIPHGDYQGG